MSDMACASYKDITRVLDFFRAFKGRTHGFRYKRLERFSKRAPDGSLHSEYNRGD